MKSIFLIQLALLLFTSCSLIKSTALNITSDLVYDGSDEIFTDGNFEFLEKALPGNLKFLEGLWYGDQNNQKLTFMLVKAYAGYSYAILETNATKDLLLEEESLEIELALLGYEKAIRYGEHYLSLNGIDKAQFYKKDFPQKLNSVFNKKLDEEDLAAVFYFSQALGSSINMQRENVKKMGYLNHVKEMLNWACSKDPNLEGGNCQLFDAVIEASTPSLLGGNPKRAKMKFEKILKKYPENLLIRLSYVQYQVLPLLDELEYQKQMDFLNKELTNWYQGQLGNYTQSNAKYLKKNKTNLYNAVAKKKYKILREIEKELF